MKNYKVDVKEIGTEQWDADMIQDYIEAESEEEAIDFATDYINENGGNAENYFYNAKERCTQ